jgi:hypothetical protein
MLSDANIKTTHTTHPTHPPAPLLPPPSPACTAKGQHQWVWGSQHQAQIQLPSICRSKHVCVNVCVHVCVCMIHGVWNVCARRFSMSAPKQRVQTFVSARWGQRAKGSKAWLNNQDSTKVRSFRVKRHEQGSRVFPGGPLAQLASAGGLWLHPQNCIHCRQSEQQA